MNVDLAACKQLFAYGALRGAVVAPYPMTEGAWNILIERQDRILEPLNGFRKTEPKVYKSLNAALADAARIGFREVRVQIQAA